MGSSSKLRVGRSSAPRDKLTNFRAADKMTIAVHAARNIGHVPGRRLRLTDSIKSQERNKRQEKPCHGPPFSVAATPTLVASASTHCICQPPPTPQIWGIGAQFSG